MRNIFAAAICATFIVGAIIAASPAWAQEKSAIESRIADVNGVKIHHLIAGKGDPVILLHGYAQTSHMWRPLIALLNSQSSGVWTKVYLVSAVATYVTGFMFPFNGFLPSHAVGGLSLVLLLLAVVTLYSAYDGAWRWIYVVTIVISVYFSAFVTVVQVFLKVPGAHALAPTQAEPPFAIAHGIVLLVFIALGIAALLKFHPSSGPRTA